MRRLVIADYGNPPSLEWQSLDAPTPRAGEVRVRVHVAGLNPIDAKTARGELSALMPTPLPAPIASDFAGVVDALGDGVTDFTVGDEVFGMVNGAMSEFLFGTADAVTARPANVSVSTAAVSAMVGLTATGILNAFNSFGENARALVIGASGGIGHFLLPQLRQHGFVITATGAADSADRLRAVGAREVIDHRADDVIARARQLEPDGYDIVVDLVNQFDTVLESAALVRRNGRFVSTLFGPDTDRFRNDITVTYIRNQTNSGALNQVAQLLADQTAHIDADHLVSADDAISGIGA